MKRTLVPGAFVLMKFKILFWTTKILLFVVLEFISITNILLIALALTVVSDEILKNCKY